MKKKTTALFIATNVFRVLSKIAAACAVLTLITDTLFFHNGYIYLWPAITVLTGATYWILRVLLADQERQRVPAIETA